MSDTLVNKIANSGLITLRPEEWVSGDVPGMIDLKDFLFMELILKEQDFREMMQKHDWSQYESKSLCVFCSADAIIPGWAYMIISSHAIPFTKDIFFGTPEQWLNHRLLAYIEDLDPDPFIDQRVIIKGCSEGIVLGPEIYMALTQKLVPIVKSLMFGEPCSTVPVYKRPKGA